MKSLILSLTLSALVALASHPLHAIDYKEEIHPILNEKCFQCHSGPRAKGKLRMDTESTFSDRIGGDDPVIVPGNPTSSLLVIKASLPRSDGEAMPPPPARARGAEPMTGVELDLVRRWITAGAKFDPSEGASGDAPMTTEAPAEVHEWTDTNNKTVKASFVALEGANISIKTEAGQVFTFPIERLSPASRELAQRLAAN